jgi:sugar lactone lactonase YvrE
MSAPTGSIDLQPFGSHLHRPECVLGSSSGDVFVPDWRGGVTVVRSNGAQHTWLARGHGFDLRPNGIALTPDGTFLIANLGDTGGVWRLALDGSLAPVLLEVDGVPLPPANYVTVDDQNRTWISISTRHRPRQLAWRPDVADGFIVLIDDRGPRVVADGLHYTNECRPDPSGQWLYAVETFGRRVLRYRLNPNGRLNSREVVLTLGDGCWPDGFAFDQEGGLWVTSLVSNRLLRFDGRSLQTVIEQVNVEFVEGVERAFFNGEMRKEHLGDIPGTPLQHVTSVAFGGADLKTACIGCLHTDTVFTFRSAVAGMPPPHWRFCLP